MPSSGYIADSFVANEQPSTAKWNELWGNDASFNSGAGFNDAIILTRHFATSGLQLPDKTLNPYKFSVYRNAAQNMTSGAFSKVGFDTRTFDTGNNFDITTNNRFIAPIAGFYWFAAAVTIGSNTGLNRFLVSLYKNGVEAKRLQDETTGNQIYTTGGSGMLQLAANDYVEVWGDPLSAVGLVTTGAVNTWFDGFLLAQA